MAAQRTRDRWRAEGRCETCGAGKMPPEITWTGVRCPECAARNVARMRAWREANRDRHRFMSAVSAQRRIARLRAAGLCLICEDAAKPYRDRCVACTNYAASQERERRARKKAGGGARTA